MLQTGSATSAPGEISTDAAAKLQRAIGHRQDVERRHQRKYSGGLDLLAELPQVSGLP